MRYSCFPKQISLNFTESFKKYRADISAALLTDDGKLWLGSDETASIERLSFIDDQNFDSHQHFPISSFINLPAPEDQEIDIEGLGYTDNYLWFVGSHSYKRKKPKQKKTDAENLLRLATVVTEPNRYILGRIPLVDGELLPCCLHPQNPEIQLTAAKLEVTPQGNLLMEALTADSHLGGFIKSAIPGKDNGFDIEGMAIYQNRIFLGLRGPVLRGWAVMLEIELEESTPGTLTLQQIGECGQYYKKHFIFLNGLGIRDLCLDGDSLLILAGPTMDLDGPVQVYRTQNPINSPENSFNYPEVILDIPYGNGEDHAEGITLLQKVTGIPSLLVAYDSPAKTRLVGDNSLIADIFELC